MYYWCRTYVNGKIVEEEMLLYNGDRIVWGNNHFFKLNCSRQRRKRTYTSYNSLSNSNHSNHY